MAYPAQSDWLRWCIPAGRISGVRVGIHWSFPLFILLYSLNAWHVCTIRCPSSIGATATPEEKSSTVNLRAT